MICNSLESIDYYAYYAASSVLYFGGEQQYDKCIGSNFLHNAFLKKHMFLEKYLWTVQFFFLFRMCTPKVKLDAWKVPPICILRHIFSLLTLSINIWHMMTYTFDKLFGGILSRHSSRALMYIARSLEQLHENGMSR
jgi:hypothetical protein